MKIMARWCVGLLLVALPWSEVYAHAALIKAAPAQDAVLTVSPATVSMWFNEPVEAAFSVITLNDSRQRVVASGALQALSDNGLSLVITAALPAGSYTVRYRVLSVDGHIVEDHFTFSIEAASAQ